MTTLFNKIASPAALIKELLCYLQETLPDVAVLAVKGAEQILKREVDAKAHAELLDQLKAQL